MNAGKMNSNISDVYQIVDLVLADKRRCQKIKNIMKVLIFDNDVMQSISDIFTAELQLALEEKESSLQMENTYIPELPDGTEEGVYLAVDLGGTNFRVILMELKNSQVIREEVKHYDIPNDYRIGCGDRLFDYLAECVVDFIKEKGLTKCEVPLGFTFSFPTRQHSLDSGCLVTWTKSFNCPSIVNEDVVKKLRESLKKHNCENVKILAILNDTTGTLVQGASLDKNTRIGIVLGTGTNACYMEHADRVKHWETQRHGEKNVIIDVEWGAFGDNGVLDFIKTDFDRAVDDGSLLANSFTFEKYIAGKYLGELCRVIQKRLLDEHLYLRNSDKSKFPGPGFFGSDNVSKIEADAVENTNNGIHEVFAAYEYKFNQDYDEDDIKILKYICGIISKRAAQLIAITTAILLNRMDENEVTIAIDGSVYKHHPRLRHWISYYTSKFAPNKKSKFMLAHDGSGKGAALVAAIAKKLMERTYV